MTTAITSRDEMEQAFEQLERLYQSLAALRRQIEPANPRNFAVLAEGHLEHIRRLRRELDEYAGVMALDEQAAPLWLRVVGPEIEWPAAPTSVLTAILDAFRKGVQSVAELILTGELTTRPTAELKRATDFRVVAMAPGSLRVGVQLPFEEGKVAEAVSRALGDYLKTAAWVASDRPDEELHAQVPDERRRRLLLTELSRLAPRERGPQRTQPQPGPVARTVAGRGLSRGRGRRALRSGACPRLGRIAWSAPVALPAALDPSSSGAGVTRTALS